MIDEKQCRMTEAYKKAALHLHGLDEPDRSWVLGRLPEQQRSELVSMLDELSMLGIPHMPTLLSDLDGVRKDREDPENDAVDCGPPSYVNIIAKAAPAKVTAILRAESVAIVAAVLQVRHWPWRQAVLEAFEASYRKQVSEAMEEMEGRLTLKVQECILQILADRLASASESLPADDYGAFLPWKRWQPAFMRRWTWRR